MKRTLMVKVGMAWKFLINYPIFFLSKLSCCQIVNVDRYCIGAAHSHLSYILFSKHLVFFQELCAIFDRTEWISRNEAHFLFKECHS